MSFTVFKHQHVIAAIIKSKHQFTPSSNNLLDHLHGKWYLCASSNSKTAKIFILINRCEWNWLGSTPTKYYIIIIITHYLEFLSHVIFCRIVVFCVSYCRLHWHLVLKVKKKSNPHPKSCSSSTSKSQSQNTGHRSGGTNTQINSVAFLRNSETKLF